MMTRDTSENLLADLASLDRDGLKHVWEGTIGSPPPLISRPSSWRV